MLVPVIPATLNNFARMRLVFLLRRIGKKAHVVVDVKVEEGARFTTCFVDDEVVKCVVLQHRLVSVIMGTGETHSWDDEILL